MNTKIPTILRKLTVSLYNSNEALTHHGHDKIERNCLLVETMKSKTDAAMQRMYLQLINYPKGQVMIKKHVLDNKISATINISSKQHASMS